MGYFRKIKAAVKSLAVQAGMYQVRINDSTNNLFHIFGVSANTWSFDSLHSYINAFEKCPPLSSVLLRKSQAASNGKIWILKTGTEDESNSQYAKLLKRIFTRPNFLQTWKQFYAQSQIYKNLYGYCVILVTKPAGFSDRLLDSSSMWCLPPWCLEIKPTKKFIYCTSIQEIFEFIKFNNNGSVTPLDLNSLIILRDFTPSVTTPVLPESRIKPLADSIQNIVSALKSNNIIIRRRGGIGILSSSGKDAIGNIAIKPDEKQEIQDKLKMNYGLTEDQSEIIITQASLQWQPMAFDAKQLMLHETIANSSAQICNQTGFPFRLLHQDQGGSLNSNEYQEARKTLYQDTVIPETESDFETFNDFFQTGDHGINVQIDFSHLEILQKSKKDEAQALQLLNRALEISYRNNIITRNQWLQSVSQETVPDGDEYYYQFLKRTQLQQPSTNSDKDQNN